MANQGVGMGGALGMLKAAGMGFGGIGKTAISNVLDSKSKKGAVARTVANVATGGMYGVAETFAKGGFTALAKHFMKSQK